MRIPRNILRFAEVLILSLVLTLAAYFTTELIQGSRYGRTSHRINQKLHAMWDRVPHEVSAEVWQVNVTWSTIAHCNICFSESHVPYTAMVSFERDLDARLAASPDLEFFDWFWSRIAETSPHGKRYVTNFKPQRDEHVRLAQESGSQNSESGVR